MRKNVIVVLSVMILCAGCGQKVTGPEADSIIEKQDTATDIQSSDGQSDNTERSNETPVVIVAGEGDNTDTPVMEEDITEANAKEEGDDSLNMDGMSGRDLFADFIMGKDSAVAASGFRSEMRMTEGGVQEGKSYTVNDLKDIFAKDETFAGTDPKISYAPLSCHGELMYAMELIYELDYETFSEYFILSDHTGELEFKFAIDGWSRRGITINDEGIVFDSGSNGAGSHASSIYAPDKNFTYETVSDVEEQYYGYSFYDANDNPIDALNETIQEAGEGNPDAMDVAFYHEIINGKSYFYYLGGSGKITQFTVDYIDGIAKKHGFKFDGKAAADEARSLYEKELDVEAACNSQEEPHWKTINR